MSGQQNMSGALMMAPLTIVFFIIIGVVLADNIAYFAMHRELTILFFSFAGFVAVGIEFYFPIRKAIDEEDKKTKILDKQRKMVLELFGDTLEELDDE